jgi:hypothetical protein
MNGRRRTILIFGLAMLATVATSLPLGAGQFAGERFAPSVVDAEDANLDITSITADTSAPPEVSFVVGFREGFPPPGDGYRVSVNLGDPTGKRWRWTLTMSDGQAVGLAETGDGTVWDQSGPARVSLDPEAGKATLVAASVDEAVGSMAGIGPALWASVEVPTPLGSVGRTTTYFSYDSLAGPADSPSLPTGSWGWIRDADGIRVDGSVYVAGSPGTVAWVNRALVVSAPDPAPGLLLDQPVTASADLVRVLDASGGDGAGYVLINRVTGEVQVFDLEAGAATEVVDASSTVVPAAGIDTSTPPSTRNVAIDLAALGVALGLPDDPSELAVTLDRAFTLGDGSVVTTTGVAATLASLQQAGSQPTPATEPAEEVVVPVESDSEEFPVALAALIAGFALLVLAAVIVMLLLRRRDRRRHESLVAEGWFESDLAPQPAKAGEAVPGEQGVAYEVVEYHSVAVHRVESEAAAPQAGPTEAPSGSGAEAEVVDLDAPDEADEAGAGGAKPVSADAARRTQERALADLEAQFADLIERADRVTHDEPRRD